MTARCAGRLAIVLLSCAATLMADGGAIQLRRTAGDLIITVFTAPVPLRAGPADFSVLLQDASTGGPILSGQVELRLTRAGSSPVTVQAVRGNATNKLLYAANVEMEAGHWELLCTVTERGETVQAAATVKVLPRASALRSEWPYFAIVPAAILLFILNRWLKAANAVRGRGLGV